MEQIVEAIYENGLLRPLEPLQLREQQRVAVVIDRLPVQSEGLDWLDFECMDEALSEGDDGVTLEEVRAILAKIPGSIADDFVAERDEK